MTAAQSMAGPVQLILEDPTDDRAPAELKSPPSRIGFVTEVERHDRIQIVECVTRKIVARMGVDGGWEVTGIPGEYRRAFFFPVAHEPIDYAKAEEELARAVRAADPWVFSISFTEGDDVKGTLQVSSVSAQHGQYHPDSSEFEKVATYPAVLAALEQMTHLGAGTDSLQVRSTRF